MRNQTEPLAVAFTPMLPYELELVTIVTSGSVLVSVATTKLAVESPTFLNGTRRSTVSPGRGRI